MYPATLPNWVILTIYLQILWLLKTYVIFYLICKNESFNFFFSVLLHFVYFSCLVALANVASTISERSNNSSHPCLIPDLRRTAVNYSAHCNAVRCFHGFSFVLFCVDASSVVDWEVYLHRNPQSQAISPLWPFYRREEWSPRRSALHQLIAGLMSSTYAWKPHLEHCPLPVFPQSWSH